MQRVEIGDDFGKDYVLTKEQRDEYFALPPEELKSDEVDINDMVWRTATRLWDDGVFTLDELAGRMMQHRFAIPESQAERDEMLIEKIYEAWRRQKKLARAAGINLPTMVNGTIDGTQYYGIVTPKHQHPAPIATTADKPVTVQSVTNVTNAPSKQSANHTEVQATTPANNEEEPGTTPIARAIFEQFLVDEHDQTNIEMATIMRSLPIAQPKIVREIIQIMIDNGYLSSFSTGSKKRKRTWLTMEPDVKQEIQEEIRCGSFDDCLDSIIDLR
jgi:hypothetical protein